MNERRKWTERLKTAAIVLLSCSAVILFSMTGLVSPAALQSLRADGTDDLQEAIPVHSGSVPMVISINLGDDLRYGVKYDGQRLRDVYSGFSVSLGEALASAGEPAATDRSHWERVMSGGSVFMDFLYPMPLSSLAAGLGVQMDSSAGPQKAARICLGADAGSLRLFYCSEGAYYFCETALRSDSLNISGELVSNGAAFAWESGEGADPDFLILADMPEFSELTAVNTLSTAMENSALLDRVGMNAVIASRYPESDGSTVYVESEHTLRVSANGAVSYHYYVSNEVTTGVAAETEALETAWLFAERTVGTYCSGAALHLKEMSFDAEKNLWCAEFAYVVNGIPVALSGENCAARVYVQGDIVTAAEMTFRSFEAGEGKLSPLPDKQAAAAMRAQSSTAGLTYFESAEGCTLQWEKTGEVD